jgi:hypothetical protein
MTGKWPAGTWEGAQHQGNAKQTHYDTPPLTCKDGCYHKDKCCQRYGEKGTLYSVTWNVDWHCDYGKHGNF